MNDEASAGPRPSLWRLFAREEPWPATDGPEVPDGPEGKGTVYWAMQALPEFEAPQHFLVCGAVGSGKTIAIRLFLQSIAHRFQPGWHQPEQLVVFDAKMDAIPLLAGMGLRPEDERVWILNPMDARSAVWNVADAVTEPVMARHFATLLVPEERGSTSPFFADAARELVYATILALNHRAGTQWTLRDLLHALESRDHLERVTAGCERARVLAERILHDDRHSSGVLSTLGTKLGRFEQVAALWHRRPEARRFSVADFLARPGVLILGNDPLLRESFWPINAILLRALSQHLLRGPEVRGPRHWFVLDEFRAMERVDCIHDLLNRGRSKGVSVLLGLQSIVGLIDVYGAHAANDLLSACSYKTFLRLGDPETAAWAQKYFGTVRQMETSETRSSTGQSSTAHQLHERPLLIASYFLALPFPRLGGDYQAVADVPCRQRTYLIRRPFAEVLARCRPPADVPELMRFGTPADQVLTAWTAAEERRFLGPDQPAPETDGDAPPEGGAAPRLPWEF